MSDNFVLEIEELKVIYKEIIDGFSYDEASNCFIKHLNDLENAEVVRIKSQVYKKFKLDGLPDDQERLKQIMENEDWSTQKEAQIVDLKYLISDNEKNLPSILIPQQKLMIEKIVQEKRRELGSLLLEKRKLIGATANEFSEKEAFYYLIHFSIFNDRELKEKRFNDVSALTESEELEIHKYAEAIDRAHLKFSENNIKKISILSFFISPFSYCRESIHSFLGKPMCQITPYQSLLFSLGSRNLGVLSNTEVEPPALLDDVKLDDIVTWYDQQHSIIVGRRKIGK